MKELFTALADFISCDMENHDCKNCKCHVTMNEVTTTSENKSLCGILATIIMELNEGIEE